MKTVLCVEDSISVLELRTTILERFSYHVIGAGSGTDALRHLREQHIDLVILDYGLPDMTGTALAHKVRFECPQCPLVLLTGEPDLPEKELQPFDAVILKGRDPSELLAKIAQLLQRQLGKRA